MDSLHLCRGKRKDRDHGWVVGYILPMPNTKTVKILVWNKSYIDGSEGKQEFDVYDVEPDTVGRCSGLTDKNGRLIFKGDIVRCYDGSAAYVTLGFYDDYYYDAHAYGWYWVGVSGNKKGKHATLDPEWYEQEVIGNVTDNPELLEGEEILE